MKKLTIPCDFGGKTVPFPFYVGDPSPRRHPLHFQELWLRTERGGTIPTETIDGLRQIQTLALEQKRPFEEVCVEEVGRIMPPRTSG
ncbi:MAG TPA: DUF2610 domain-containing protein [Longimicrobium sp.]|nr:DUF2610 domain-containing protein [Longimicrobium sp.]